MTVPRPPVTLLLRAGRLLLEYNECTATIHRALTSAARALTEQPCHIAVSYGTVAVSLAGESPVLETVGELRFNTAVQARVHEILEEVRRGQLGTEAALIGLERVVAETPKYSRSQVALALGAAAVALAALLGADLVAAASAGAATALGLIARQELGRRHFSLLALPLTAAFIGAALGGLVIRLGWTGTPELVLAVPALMVVPGPHLINGILDLIDNYLSMSLARLGLALGILLASATGIILGVELTLPDRIPADETGSTDRLNLVLDLAYAAIVTCGFAVFYNTARRHLWPAVLGGMTGHGLRFLALELGCRIEMATFLGGLAVGMISAWITRSLKLPVAVIAFAGAVTMIPGLTLYRALVGAVQLARMADHADAMTLAATLANLLHGSLVVSGLALGLILGSRTILAQVPNCEPPR